jgi:DNA repair protein RecO (recombination protein O)
MAGAAQRVQLQPAYVLHHRPYRDTSRILELLTRDHGRVSAFARGARGQSKVGKTRANPLVPALQPFHRLLVSYSVRGEAGQLTGAEFDGGYVELPAGRTLSGFYLNELLLRLFERHDPHTDAFDLYDATLTRLKQACDEAVLLRVFEKRLLALLGYGLLLDTDAASGAPVQPDRVYRYQSERGITLVTGVAEGSLLFRGTSLLALHHEQLTTAEARADARRLLRAALDKYLAGNELRSRQVSTALRRMTTA